MTKQEEQAKREADQMAGKINELATRIQKSEKIKENYKSQLSTLKQEKSQIKEQVKEVNICII